MFIDMKSWMKKLSHPLSILSFTLLVLTQSQAFAMSVADYQYSIVEVVIPKPDDSKVVYDRFYPINKIPFKERNDKFQSIGTAWFIDKKTLISAAHVITYQTAQPNKSVFVRNLKGEVFEIQNVLKYDTAKDLIAFDLKTYPQTIKPLAASSNAKIGDSVCAPGNALGEGISLRCSGEVSSFQPEPVDGKWQELYFSTPVSPGNSGGPLINQKNQVIGVVVRKIENQSLNIATPIKELLALGAEANVRFGDIKVIDSNVKDIRTDRDMKWSTPLPLAANTFFDSARKDMNRQWMEMSKEMRAKYIQFGFFSKS